MSHAKPPHRWSSLLGFAMLALSAGCATTKTSAVHWKPLPAEAFDQPLSIPECMALVHASDLTAAQMRARLAAAQAALDATNEIPNPHFQPTWEDLGLHSAGAGLFNVTYMASFPIFYWWTKKTENAAAEAQKRSVEVAIGGELATIDLDMGAAWYELAAAQRKADVSKELARESQDALTLARERRRLGSISDHELRQAEAEALQGGADVAAAEAAARKAGLELAFAMGSERPAVVRPAMNDGLTSWTMPQLLLKNARTYPIALGDMPPQAVIDKTLEIDPSTAQTQADLEAAEAQLAAEERKRIPLGDTSAGAGMKREPEGWGKVFSLDLPIPIFNWNSSAIAAARAAVAAAQAAQEKARRGVIARVAGNWDAWRAAQLNQETYAAPLDAARRQLATEATELFRAGQISYTDMLQARRDRDQAALAAIEQWSALMVARWKLRTDVGETSVDEPPALALDSPQN